MWLWQPKTPHGASECCISRLDLWFSWWVCVNTYNQLLSGDPTIAGSLWCVPSPKGFTWTSKTAMLGGMQCFCWSIPFLSSKLRRKDRRKGWESHPCWPRWGAQSTVSVCVYPFLWNLLSFLSSFYHTTINEKTWIWIVTWCKKKTPFTFLLS